MLQTPKVTPYNTMIMVTSVTEVTGKVTDALYTQVNFTDVLNRIIDPNINTGEDTIKIELDQLDDVNNNGDPVTTIWSSLYHQKLEARSP